MKKKLLSGIFSLALLIATGYGVSQNLKSDAGLSDLALRNVEALARSENPGTDWDCDPSDTIVCYWDSKNNRHYGLLKWL
ncbi:MAG: NVEALA domain-containing protein [Proteiniphilum sp.]|nr:NVEALA domain-containing protein [Proteiniphilum sp.]